MYFMMGMSQFTPSQFHMCIYIHPYRDMWDIYTEIKVSQAVTHHFDITTLDFFFIILFHFLKMLVLMD